MEPLYAVLLGIIQGLTEFLPVSSSGHLVLAQHLFGMTEPELLFDISLHIGTLLAICLVFYREIQSILTTLLRLPLLLKSAGGLRSLLSDNANVRLTAMIIAGSVPTAIIGVLFHQVTDQLFGTVWIVGVMLLITGTFLWLTRLTGSIRRPLERMTFKDALMIGLVQGLAILPGISRSGSTISAALFLGVDREVAGRYSFLLSVPAILGALLMSLNSSSLNTSVPISMMLLGAATAGLVGYVALKLLMRLVKQGRLYRFAPYCWILGLAALTTTLG
jgi:undecaprenyl-diphosphatase